MRKHAEFYLQKTNKQSRRNFVEKPEVKNIVYTNFFSPHIRILIYETKKRGNCLNSTSIDPSIHLYYADPNFVVERNNREVNNKN
jgi:hypothetical protein